MNNQEEIAFVDNEAKDISFTLSIRTSSTDFKKVSKLIDVILTSLNLLTNLKIVTIEAEHKVKSSVNGKLLTYSVSFRSDGLVTKVPF